MPYVDRPLPEDLHLPTLREKRTANLLAHRNSGRKGHPDKITRDIKQGITEAAINIGRDGNGEGGLVGYLEDLALNHKKCFTSLLVKVLPMSIAGEGLSGARIGTVHVHSIPSGNFLSTESIDQLRAGTLQLDRTLQIEQIAPDPIAPAARECEPQPNQDGDPRLTALENKLMAMDHSQLLELAEAFNVGRTR